MNVTPLMFLIHVYTIILFLLTLVTTTKMNVTPIDLTDSPTFDESEPFFVNAVSSTPTRLIGNAEERNLLREEQGKAYEESLRTDQLKTEKEAEKIQEERRLVDLQACRAARVLPEPLLTEAHVNISIRHPIEGNKVRLFHEHSTFQQVYDWAGSLCQKPEYYELRDFQGLVSPEKPVVSGVYNMHEVGNPVFMSPTGTVAFQGYSVKDDTEPVASTSQATEKIDIHDHYDLIKSLRDDECSKFNKSLILEVDRENVFHELIEHYKKRNTCTSLVTIRFIGEDGVGDGVTRDAYSEFFQHMYTNMEGSHVKVPITVYDDTCLEIIGKVITHAFVSCNIFPVCFSKVSLKHYLFGEVPDAELLEDFNQYLPPAERQLTKKPCVIKNQQALMDIFSEYSIFQKPSYDNIESLLLKSAKIALLRLPCFSIQSIIKGMGNFRKKMNSDMFDAIYECCTPTAENIIRNLESNEVNKQDQKVTTWLHRYIRSFSKDALVRFVRFHYRWRKLSSWFYYTFGICESTS